MSPGGDKTTRIGPGEQRANGVQLRPRRDGSRVSGGGRQVAVPRGLQDGAGVLQTCPWGPDLHRRLRHAGEPRGVLGDVHRAGRHNIVDAAAGRYSGVRDVPAEAVREDERGGEWAE